MIHIGRVPATPSDRGTIDTSDKIHTSNLILEVLVLVETVDAGRFFSPSHLDHPFDAYILKRCQPPPLRLLAWLLERVTSLKPPNNYLVRLSTGQPRHAFFFGDVPEFQFIELDF